LGVLANFVDEIPERDVTAGDVFKSIVTGDPISTERKNRDPFEFRPIAGHILSANVLPGTIDQSDGYWRRFVICPFTRKFENDPSRRPDAAAEVVQHELPAVAAWALEGAARLQRQGKYSTTEVAQKTLAEWRDEAELVRRFLLERSGLNEMRANVLYDEWRTWARGNGFADMSSTRVRTARDLDRALRARLSQGRTLLQEEGHRRVTPLFADTRERRKAINRRS
jgi:putative DNA primase/helicase